MPMIELAGDECQRVLNALGGLPWRDVNDLIVKIATQMNQQAQAKQHAQQIEEVLHGERKREGVDGPDHGDPRNSHSLSRMGERS